MAYARRCPYCGAYLDPCEICDCIKEEKMPLPEAQTPETAQRKITTNNLHHKEEKVNV